MSLDKYAKAAGETKRYAIDYSNWLDTGEILTNIQFAVTPVTAPPLVANSPAYEAGALAVQYFVSGGLDGKTYEVLVTVTTSSGQIKEDVVVFSVREPG